MYWYTPTLAIHISVTSIKVVHQNYISVIAHSSKCSRDTGCVITEGRGGEAGQPQLQRGAGDRGHPVAVPERASQAWRQVTALIIL